MIRIHIVPRNQKDLYMAMLPPDFLSRELLLVGAYDDVSGQIAGVLAAFSYESQLEIGYIAVTRSHLRQGIGSGMLEMLMTMAQAMLVESVTACYVMRNEDIKKRMQADDPSRYLDFFFEKNGFRKTDTSEVYAIKIVKLGRNLPTPGVLPAPAKIVPMREVTETKWNLLRESIKKKAEEHADVVQNEGTIYMDPGDFRRYDKDVSCLYFNVKGEPAGCLLISKRLDGIYMDYFCMLDQDIPSKKAMVSMFDFAYQEAVNVHDVAVIFYVNTANKASDNIFSKLAGASKRLYGTAYERTVDF